jgi:hypothetical protein
MDRIFNDLERLSASFISAPTVLMKVAHPKTKIGRTLLAKMCFDFMADILNQ